jgi:hypothetical protein
MRFGKVLLLTAAVAGPAAAQQTTGGGSIPAATTGGTGTGTGTGTSQAGGGTTGSTTQAAAVPDIGSLGGVISGTASDTPAAGGVISPSNFLGGSFSNPYYQGTYTNTAGTPGGFGTVLFGTGAAGTGATGTRATGAATARTTTAAGRVGGANPFGTSASPFGGATGAGGRAGGFGGAAGATSAFGGQVIPLPRNIAYTAVLRFPTPAIVPAQRVADVQAVFARSTQFGGPAAVSVLADGPVLVLRGRVGSEDEARLAEGMVRLTPGVREVRNELTFPTP